MVSNFPAAPLAYLIAARSLSHVGMIAGPAITVRDLMPAHRLCRDVPALQIVIRCNVNVAACWLAGYRMHEMNRTSHSDVCLGIGRAHVGHFIHVPDSGAGWNCCWCRRAPAYRPRRDRAISEPEWSPHQDRLRQAGAGGIRRFASCHRIGKPRRCQQGTCPPSEGPASAGRRGGHSPLIILSATFTASSKLVNGLGLAPALRSPSSAHAPPRR